MSVAGGNSYNRNGYRISYNGQIWQCVDPKTGEVKTTGSEINCKIWADNNPKNK